MLSAPMMWLIALANFASFFAGGIRLAQKAEETDEEKMKIGE
jgi:hypothetical protein